MQGKNAAAFQSLVNIQQRRLGRVGEAIATLQQFGISQMPVSERNVAMKWPQAQSTPRP